MIGEDFLFNGKALSDFGMAMYDPENEQIWVSREIDKADISSMRPQPNHYGVHYSDVEKLEFLIIKNDEIYSGNDFELDAKEINNIRAWLESPKYPVALELTDNNREIIYYGVFTEVRPFLVATRCYGLYLTFTCDSPYGYYKENKKTFSINGSTSVKTDSYYLNTGELNDFVKPIIKVSAANSFGNGKTLKIENGTDNNKYMLLKLPSSASYITVDCKKKIVKDNLGNIIPLSESMVVSENSDYYSYLSVINASLYWLRLLPKKNDLSFLAQYGGVKSIEISAQGIAKAGGF